jgi:low temperature requirement protein LtrA
MNLLRQTFRQWWQVPRRASEQIDHRTVSFLELFYDLVYVVLIAELSHTLATHPDGTGILQFAFLFLTVWWAWLNGSIYHDIHGNNDIRTRVFTFLQMITVAAMAVFAHDAMGETSTGFALAYAAFLLILTFLWWRSGVHDADHRPLSRPYVQVFLLTIVLFVLSIFVPAPWKFIMWGIGLLLSIVLPIYTLQRGRGSAEIAQQIAYAFDISASAVERFGLFTIIVLGEVVVGVVQGLASHHAFTWQAGGTALLGMLIAIGLWWIYFDFVSHRKPRTTQIATTGWLYLHLPLTISITAVGAAVLNMVEHAGEELAGDVRWLLTGAIAVAFITIALLIQTVQQGEAMRPVVRIGSMVILVAGILIGLLGASAITTLPLLISTIALMLIPIFFGVWLWIKRVLAAQGAVAEEG